MKYNYQHGDGGVVDETSAEFKAMGDNVKAKKKESVGELLILCFQACSIQISKNLMLTIRYITVPLIFSFID